MRSVVLLPHPDGPTSTTNSWSAMARSIAVDGLDAAGIDLGDFFEFDSGHADSIRGRRMRVDGV